MLAVVVASGLLLGSAPAVAQVNSPASVAAFVNALERDSEKEVRTWLVRGIDPNAMTEDQSPAIVFAASKKAYRAMLVLLETPETDVNRQNARAETALMLASLHGEAAVVKKLLSRGAEVNKPGWTPLHYAAAGGHVDIVKLLLDEHAYVDAQSPNGTTPLMMAARHRFAPLARLLVEEGADPTQRNESGLTAADYFQRYGDADQAKWFADRAREFESRYGTVDRPKVDGAAAPGK